MKKKRKKTPTMGQELLTAIREAIAHPEKGRIVRPVDVSSIRKRLHLSQREFAENYRIKLQTLRQWEQGVRCPDSATIAYLTCIARKPDVIREILEH